MTKQKLQKGGAKGKGRSSKGRQTAAQLRDADELTASRVRAILSDPKMPSSVAGKLQRLVNKLGELTDAPAPDTADFYADTFLLAAETVRGGMPNTPDERAEAAPLYADVARYAERHEPEAHKLARRSREIYAEWLGRKKGRRYADGAHFFVEHTNAVLEGGEGLNPNPDSKYFEPLFVEAFNERGPRDRQVRRLLDLIKRVDEGADLNALRDEATHASKEREQAHRPKDARLVDALSDVLSNPKRRGEREAILIAVNDLSNMTPVSDLHPDVFPTLARVLIREARAALKGKGLDDYKRRMLRVRLGELARIAGE
jgi:hypothetical protein